MRGRIDGAINLKPRDQIVIGTSHVGLLATGVGWPGPRIVVRSGEDGADLALLEVLLDERVNERFEEVVVVSGDAIFADAVARLGELGVTVTVVARREACARRLRFAAARTVYLRGAADGLGGAA
ncbi:NYN domain-containing protein [Mycolicibacterium septicum]|uniref:NYN domain-containing protein n=1 Tax=Mycolicibacterium septicum TaxID=98668 RepID=UPI0039088958